MNSMVAFQLLPITIVIIILFLTFQFIRGNVRNRRQKLFKGKILHLFFSCYLVLLLAGMILYAFIPFEKYEHMEATENYGLKPNAIGDIYEGKIDPNIKVGDKFTFEYVEDTLNISVDTNESLGITVIIEKKETNDGVIEATNYFNSIIVEKIDFTEKIPSMSAVISGNTLLLQEPQQANIRISKPKKEFTISQFTGVTDIDDMSYFHGESVFYMQIPKDLKVISPMDNIYIHYVGE